jgi:DNA-binding response OmpR family regulator
MTRKTGVPHVAAHEGRGLYEVGDHGWAVAGRCRERSIVIAEDDSLVLSLLVRIFDGPNWKVRVHQNGESALNGILRGDCVDLLIADMDMPLMDGVELCCSLCDHDCPIPSILITGRIPDDVDLANMPSCVACVLDKPFDVEHLPRTARLILCARDCDAPAVRRAGPWGMFESPVAG